MSKLFAMLDALRCAKRKLNQLLAVRSKIEHAPFAVPKLTALQKREIKSYWGRYGTHINTAFHRWYYATSGIEDVRMMPNGYFESTVLPFYNRTGLSNIPQSSFLHQAWTDKAYFDRFFPELRFPKSIVRNANGYFMDEHYQIISKEEAIGLLKMYPKIVVKPSLNSGGGLNVKLVQDYGTIETVLTKYRCDYVIQEVVEQHPQMSLLNESSVNVVRITSFLFHGQVHLLSACVRVGAPGKFTDNYIDKSGGSMLTIGLESDGKLKRVGFFANGLQADKCLNGYVFAGTVIPAYSKMQEIAVCAHKKMPYFGLVGWDFVVSNDGLPTVMEFNIASPGITYYQYCNGPFFGDLTDEVLADVSKRYYDK